jgi:hypothetical protein
MAKRARKDRMIAVHEQSDDLHVVGLGNLRVFIIEDEGMWFAQCQDINYAAQGASLAEVKQNFEQGLAATVDEHLKVFGNIENLLASIPSSRIRQELMRKIPQAFRYSQVTIHRLPEALQKVIPFQAIEFIQPIAA